MRSINLVKLQGHLWNYSSVRAVVLQHQPASESSGGLVKIHLLGPTRKAASSGGQGGQRIYICHRFPGDADAGAGTTLRGSCMHVQLWVTSGK